MRPYGRITAIDLNKGEIAWQVAHGETPDNIRNNPALKGLNIPRLRVSMPQDKPGSLGRQQSADIVAYILGFNKAPAGQTEVPGDADVLKAITIAPAQ